jgi:cytochrome d ubiquinol oxidase subunit II
VLLMAIVAVWTCSLHPSYQDRWTKGGWGIPLLAIEAILVFAFWKAVPCRIHYLPLFAVLGWFMVAYAALIVALYPLVIPPGLTIFTASSPVASQSFILMGFMVLVPFTLAYSTYGFWVFRGKIRPQQDSDNH